MNTDTFWEDYRESNIRSTIRRTIVRFVVRRRQTLKVAGTYLPYLLPLANERLIRIGEHDEHGIIQVHPYELEP